MHYGLFLNSIPPFEEVLPGSSLLLKGSGSSIPTLGCKLEDSGYEIRDLIQVLRPEHNWTFFLVQKPLEGSFVENAWIHGVAGLNIDSSRIGLKHQGPLGRFPSNLILQHTPACVQKGTIQISGTSTGNGQASKGEPGSVTPLRRGSFTQRTDVDGLETLSNWICQESCPIQDLNSKVGILSSGAMTPEQGKHGGFGRCGIYNKSAEEIPFAGKHKSRGYVSRFFYQARTDTDVYLYLIRLIKPPVPAVFGTDSSGIEALTDLLT